MEKNGNLKQFHELYLAILFKKYLFLKATTLILNGNYCMVCKFEAQNTILG